MYSDKVDFHVHTNYSDGVHSPTDIIFKAAETGLSAVGITDHDSIDGLDESALAALKHSIEIIPGVEISVLEDDYEVHILGYYPQNRKDLDSALKEFQAARNKRMEAIIYKLKAFGFQISPEEVLSEAGNAAPGRLHIARVLFQKKYINNLNDAFSIYLAHNRPAYVPRNTLSLKDAMQLLADVNAIPVLAHPGKKGMKYLDRLLKLGLKGIEVFHPDHDRSTCKYYKQVALDKNILITGGSDYHGDKGVRINYTAELAIDRLYLEEMKLLLA